MSYYLCLKSKDLSGKQVFFSYRPRLRGFVSSSGFTYYLLLKPQEVVTKPHQGLKTERQPTGLNLIQAPYP
jgi:hypothetical protein